MARSTSTAGGSVRSRQTGDVAAAPRGHAASPRAEAEIRLDRNELPWAPRLRGPRGPRPFSALNRYPEAENEALIRQIERAHGLGAGSVAVTHGVDEALDRVIELFRDRSFVTFRPTFSGFYERLEANQARARCYRLGPAFRIPPRTLGHLRTSDVVLLASPNNPTGHVFLDSEIEALAATTGAVLLDETYIDFASTPGWLARRTERMFIFRSFSKAFGLAGLRAGFLVGPPDHIRDIRRRQWFCHMSAPTTSLVNAALRSTWRVRQVAHVVRERCRVTQALRHLGVEVIATETNFIVVKDASGTIRNRLARHRIRVKELGPLGMPVHVRITIDTTAHNDLVLRAVGRVHPISRTWPGSA